MVYLITKYAKPKVKTLYEKYNAPEEVLTPPYPNRYCKFRVKKKLVRDLLYYQVEFSEDGVNWYELGTPQFSKELAVDLISKYVENDDEIYHYDPTRKQLAEHKV